MTPEEFSALEKQIAAKREEREKHNQVSVAAKTKAKALSAEIRALEDKLPGPRELKSIRLKMETAQVKIRPR